MDWRLCKEPLFASRQRCATQRRSQARVGRPGVVGTVAFHAGRRCWLATLSRLHPVVEAVSFDLTLVPLDDILEFREEHRHIHRNYVDDLHRFMAELADIDDSNTRERILAERRQEIADAAQELKRPALRWLGKSEDQASFSIGLAGAAWSFSGGFDPVGLVLSAAGMASQFISGRRAPVTAYSYIFAVDREFGSR